MKVIEKINKTRPLGTGQYLGGQVSHVARGGNIILNYYGESNNKKN